MTIEPVSADDPAAKTHDVIAANIEALRALFPQAFAEGKVHFDVLRELLGDHVDEAEERYGLNWNGKRRARRLALQPSLGTLRPAKEDSVGWDETKNIVIEGDNLEVLKLLTKSYAGKVKLIYIDPPYNTGNDFVYPDDYADSLGNYLRRTGQVDSAGVKNTSNPESSGRFHTDWLNMMYPRLMLARQTLDKDTGVILISIDDAEISNIRNISDEIFGSENFICCLTWDKSRKNDAKLFSVGHEYMLVYARSLVTLREKKVVWREAKPGTRDIWLKYLELRSECGPDDKAISVQLKEWFSGLSKTHPSKKWSRYSRVDRNGPWRDRDISWPGGGGPRYDVLHRTTGEPCKVPERGWIYATSEEMQRQIKLGTVEFRDDHTEPPFRKFHLKPLSTELDESELEDTNEIENEESEEELATQVRTSYIYKQAQVSVKMLRGLMGKKVFTNPKDHEEISALVNYVTAGDQDALVMDFFAGSGTTGHAVMAQNAADGGNRRYILVQLPEPLDPADKNQKTAADFCDALGKPRTIAELTKERLRRAAKKIKVENPDTKADLGFRVYKLATSNLKRWQPRTDTDEALAADLADAADNLLPGRSNDDLLVELLLKRGIDLCETMLEKHIDGRCFQAFGGGVLVTHLGDVGPKDAETVATTIADWIITLNPPAPAIVFFRDIGFADNEAKFNVDAILRQRLKDRGPGLPDLLEAVRSV
jgi:adenine-specific DNA-methyltransferase